MSFDSAIRAMIVEVVREVLREEITRLSQQEEYLSPARAASVTGVAPGTVRRWIREGKLQARHAGRRVRVGRSELERFLKSGRRLSTDLSPEELAARDF